MTFFKRRFGARSTDSDAGLPAEDPGLIADSDTLEIGGLSMQADRPIESIAEDRFDRAPFAAQIARVVATRQDPSSLVVGLYGPWGDGKTSVLSMIRESLAAHPDVIPMDYNPWFYGSSTESITRSFFKSLAATLEKNKILSKEKIGQLMATLGKAVPQVGGAVSAVGETLATEDLTATRDKVGEVLRRHGKKIVVFIDDIDRLDRTDIQTLFKLVRLSGGFDHTTYVLAFDDVVVAEALGEAYGSGDATAGQRFLEKIVQVPLHLPPAQPEKLRLLMFSACDRAVRENGLELVDGQNMQLGNRLVSGFSMALKTPRQVKLFDNAITFAIPLLKGEVRIVDQILIEAFRIFYPSVYQAIRHNPDSVLKAAERLNPRDERVPSPVDDAINSLPVGAPEKKALKQLIVDMFPRAGQSGYGDGWDQTWSTEKRICSGDYFERYFTYAVPTGDMADSAVDELIEKAEAKDKEAVAAIVESAFDRDAIQLLVRKLRNHEETIPTAAVRAIALAIASRASRFPTTTDLFMGDFALLQASVLVANLTARLPEPDQDALLADLAQQTDSLSFIREVIRSSHARKDDRGVDRGFLSKERIQPLAATLFERMKKAAATSNLFDATEDRLARIVYCVEANATDVVQDELKAYLAQILSAGPLNAVRFLKSFAGRSQGSSGVIGVSDFSRNAYEGLAALLSPDDVYAQLKSIYGDDLDTAVWQEDWTGTMDVGRRVADQFSYLHRNPAHTGDAEEPK